MVGKKCAFYDAQASSAEDQVKLLLLKKRKIKQQGEIVYPLLCAGLH
jgi:hypothetical protein